MTSAQRPPALPWLHWRAGDRVVVRYREPDGLHDALGELLEVGPGAGDVRVPAEAMVTGRRVPPPPA
jgi:hypothetical protein